MPTSPLAGITYPDGTGYAGDAPTAFAEVVLGVEPHLILKFDSATARDAAITTPTGGMAAYLADKRRLTVYDSAATAWIPAGGAMPRVALTRSTGQTIDHATNSVITWDTETIDSDAAHSLVANTSRITMPIAGNWAIGYTLEWDDAAAAGSARAAWLQKNGNGSLRFAYNLEYPVTSADFPTVTGFTILPFAVGDYVELGCYQNTGSDVSAATGAASTLTAVFHSAT